MDTLLISILYLLLIGNTDQQKKDIYLHFDSNSKEVCNIPKSETDRFHGESKVMMYEKNVNPDKYSFYICNELFEFRNKEKIDTCQISYFDKIEFSEIEDVRELAKRINPLYPGKAFRNIYIVEEIDDSLAVSYLVEWKYYIE